MILTETGADPVAREALRAEVLRAFGAGAAEVDELLAYNRGAFVVPERVDLPLADEPCVEAWRGYAAEAEAHGVLSVLRRHLVQLRFPVAEGTSARDDYQAAVRRGVVPAEPEELRLEDAAALRLFIHPTPAGAVPVLLTPCRADFESLVRALTRKNEPAPIPPSMGAAMVGGYNNWGRVGELRRRWEAGGLVVEGADAWPTTFAVLKARKELYQDRFVLLSGGPYSGVPAEAMGMEPEEWSRASITIRLEHECAHYFTRRVLGSMRNNLHDELLADYAGIVAAAGRFRSDWFLRFMGLEDDEGCRADGRLWNYRGDPPLSDAAFAVLQRLVRAAAHQVERYNAGLPAAAHTSEGRAEALLAMATLTLEEIAAGDCAPGDRNSVYCDVN
ncbi:MAG TPA: hypothetical protein VGX50_11115 [Longimicrobium sp.]|nr:hypothetical protein [Longimicrobium sp.]